MNKKQLINKLADKTGVSKTLADHLIDVFQSAVVEALKKGEKVRLKDFGTWELCQWNERRGTNPRTGEAIVIKAKIRPHFAPGKKLLREINRKETKAEKAESAHR